MAKGKAAHSSSGASMSKYDVEVEGRLQALEKAVADLQAHSHAEPCGDDDLAAKVEAIAEKLKEL